jgi:L-methionine (R)-S-oxide reductase
VESKSGSLRETTPILPPEGMGRNCIKKLKNLARACFLLHDITFPRMKETTCKKLQEIGAFALAGGCTPKRMKQVVEMIRAARDYRWVAVYKIVKDEFVILARTGNEPPTYQRFPTTQGLCGAALESGKPVIVGDVHHDPRYLPTFHTTRSEIVVPMRNEHRHVLGMLDVESDQLNAFGEEDRQFLERAGVLIAHCLH